MEEIDKNNQQKLAERDTYHFFMENLEYYRTLKTAWMHILKETEDDGKSHWNLAELLNSRVATELRAIMNEKDHGRKQVYFISFRHESNHSLLAFKI